MPTATEPAAPKATAPKKEAKPAAEKKQSEGAAEKKPTAPAADKKPAGEKKRTTSTGDKKRTTSTGDKKQATATGEKKRTDSTGDKKRKNSTGEKKRTNSTGEKKRTNSTGEKKRTNSTGDKKQKTTEKKSAPPKRSEAENFWDEEPTPEPVPVPKLPVAVPVLNTLAWASCAKVLENLLNLTPSLGAALAHMRPFKSTQHLVDQLNLVLDTLPPSYIEAFLKRFEELPLLVKSKLTKEHKCCIGLDKLTEEQKSELQPLYTEYREKFGFPFVVCAREAKAAELGVMLRSHLLNDKDQEVQSARKEVKKIARLRLLEVVVA